MKLHVVLSGSEIHHSFGARNLCLAAIDSVKMILPSMLVSETCACPRRSLNTAAVHDAFENCACPRRSSSTTFLKIVPVHDAHDALENCACPRRSVHDAHDALENCACPRRSSSTTLVVHDTLENCACPRRSSTTLISRFSPIACSSRIEGLKILPRCSELCSARGACFPVLFRSWTLARRERFVSALTCHND